MIDLIKIWWLSYTLTRPSTVVAALIAFTCLIAIAAVFVKFKNGWISLLCFFGLELVGLFAIYTISCPPQNQEDLHLKQAELLEISDVTSEGVVYRVNRFRQRVYPLIGVQLPEESSEYYQQAKSRILDSRFDGKLRVCRSSAYSGLILYNATGGSINEILLSEGLAYCSGVSPKQYLVIQKRATKSKRGMWSLPVVTYPHQSMAFREGVFMWLVLLETLSMSALIIILWERRKRPA